MNISDRTWASAATAALCIGIGAVAVRAVQVTDWSPAVNAETVIGTDHFNTTFLDGCPAPSPNGLEFYMASNRPTDSQGRPGMGGIDIWVSRRSSVDAPWGEPENLGAPVNSSADDFCPTPQRDGKGLLFVSRRTLPDNSQCGGADIYYARRTHDQWSELRHLDCTVNSAGEEFSPFLVEYDDGARELYFSSTRAGGFSSEAPGSTTGDSDLYVSEVTADGGVAPPALVPAVNTAAHDFRPSLRRDGLELLFDSNRPDSIPNVTTGAPSLDIWSATRDSRFDAWVVGDQLGPNVNTPADETRPFLTWDRLTLFFGRAPGSEGNSDIYQTSREKITGDSQ